MLTYDIGMVEGGKAKEQPSPSLTEVAGHKACPNAGNHAEGDWWIPASTGPLRFWNGSGSFMQEHISCPCGVNGPWGASETEAWAAWDALPRAGDSVVPYRVRSGYCSRRGGPSPDGRGGRIVTAPVVRPSATTRTGSELDGEVLVEDPVHPDDDGSSGRCEHGNVSRRCPYCAAGPWGDETRDRVS